MDGLTEITQVTCPWVVQGRGGYGIRIKTEKRCELNIIQSGNILRGSEIPVCVYIYMVAPACQFHGNADIDIVVMASLAIQAGVNDVNFHWYSPR